MGLLKQHALRWQELYGSKIDITAGRKPVNKTLSQKSSLIFQEEIASFGKPIPELTKEYKTIRSIADPNAINKLVFEISRLGQQKKDINWAISVQSSQEAFVRDYVTKGASATQSAVEAVVKAEEIASTTVKSAITSKTAIKTPATVGADVRAAWKAVSGAKTFKGAGELLASEGAAKFGRFALSTVGLAAVLPGSGTENLVAGLGFSAGYEYFGKGLPIGKKLLYGAAGAVAGRLAAGMLPDSIPGKDDYYNTIEGFTHSGLSRDIRQRHAEFGSGYRGPNPWLNPAYNIAEEVPRYQLHRASKLGAPYSEMYRWMTQEEEPSEQLMASAMTGTAIHRLKEARMKASGEVVDTEKFVYDPNLQITGHIDVMFQGGIPGDVKSVSPSRFKRVQRQGAFQRHVSQLNFYMYTTGAEKGILEYVSREDLDQRIRLEIPFSPGLFQKDIERLEMTRRKVYSEIAAGNLSTAGLPKGASLQTLTEAAIQEKQQAIEDTRNIPFLEHVYQQELEYLHNVQQGKFPGMPDSGFAPTMREALTEFKAQFASRWDPMRKLATKIFSGAESKAMQQLRGTSEFQWAMEEALESQAGKILGERGTSAEVRAYTTKMMYRGKEHEFEFAAKIFKPEAGQPFESVQKAFRREAEYLQKAEGLYSPTYYGQVKKNPLLGTPEAIFMEKFNVAGELSQQELANLPGIIGKYHERGITHMDLYKENILRVMTEEGPQVGLIDLALANRAQTIEKHLYEAYAPKIEKAAEAVFGAAKVAESDVSMLFQQSVDMAGAMAYAEGASANWARGLYHNMIFGYGSTRVGALTKAQEVINTGSKMGEKTILTEQRALIGEFHKKAGQNIDDELIRLFSTANADKTTNKKIISKQRFRDRATKAVGVGLRQAHSAGKKHGQFSSTIGTDDTLLSSVIDPLGRTELAEATVVLGK